MIEQLKLCLVTDQTDPQFIQDAILGGVSCIQLRVKNKPPAIIKNLALELQSLLKPKNIPLIINDDIQLAKEINADGVHLGQSDQSVDDARKILGDNKIIGLSIESLEQLESANTLNNIDYVAASALFPTPSKTNCKTYWGLEGLTQFVKLSKHPVVAIGGINQSNIYAVMQCGVVGVAVISAIQNSRHPRKSAEELSACWKT